MLLLFESRLSGDCAGVTRAFRRAFPALTSAAATLTALASAAAGSAGSDLLDLCIGRNVPGSNDT